MDGIYEGCLAMMPNKSIYVTTQYNQEQRINKIEAMKNIHNLSDDENEIREFIKAKLNMTDEQFDNTDAKEIKRLLMLKSAEGKSN